MCGITGIFKQIGSIDRNELYNALKTLKHRGPDGTGLYINDTLNFGMGHCRLAFLDASIRGNQPMISDDGDIILAFNGEVYNATELRNDLITKGYFFKGRSDTEVILNGYKEWGLAYTSRLLGMFAIVIYDKSLHKIFLLRDRFGIKPLYYYFDGVYFAFSSEVKALFEYGGIKKQIRKLSVSLFLANRYVPTPFTMWDNVFKLSPATILSYNFDNNELTTERYWALDNSIQHNTDQNIETQLEESIRLHLVSDFPVGFFLSGGMDSSVLLALASKHRTVNHKSFSIGFTNWEKTEHILAKKVADKVTAENYSLVLDRFTSEEIEHIIYFYDDPIADISIFPTYKLSEFARKQVKATISGEGSDELFGGYHWHKNKFSTVSILTRLPFMRKAAKFRHIKAEYVAAMSMGLFDSQELKKAFTSSWQNEIPTDPFAHFDQYQRKDFSRLKQLQFLDMNCFMYELVLQKIDRASMANSLEVRVPFLNHNFVSYVWNLPENQYYDKTIQKKPLLNILKQFYPVAWFSKQKQGFTGSDAFYQKYELYDLALSNGILVKEHIIKREYIDSLLKNKDHWRLWKLYILEYWWRVHNA